MDAIICRAALSVADDVIIGEWTRVCLTLRPQQRVGAALMGAPRRALTIIFIIE